MNKWVKKTVLSPCTMPISSGEAFVGVWTSGCRSKAKTISSSLMRACGFSHHLEDGCKSMCVKFRGWKPNKTGDMVSLMHVYTKSALPRKIIHPAMGWIYHQYILFPYHAPKCVTSSLQFCINFIKYRAFLLLAPWGGLQKIVSHRSHYFQPSLMKKRRR